jgi:hypothetical protein
MKENATKEKLVALLLVSRYGGLGVWGHGHQRDEGRCAHTDDAHARFSNK